MAKIYRGLLFNEQCRFYLTDATDIVEDINATTTYSPTAIAAVGRSTMITAILGKMQKDDATISTIIDGGGEIGNIIATANTEGKVKGKVGNPLANPEKINETKLNVGGAVGTNGFLKVVKDLKLKEPFVGQVPLISGEIGIDYASYFVLSEQVPTAIAVGVLVNKDHSIKNASCFIVQLMPDCDDDVIDKVEKLFSDLPHISEIMSELNPEEFLEKYLKDEYEVLEVSDVHFECDCSKERFLLSLQMLPPSDIIELKKDENIECVCDFCHKVYNIKGEEL